MQKRENLLHFLNKSELKSKFSFYLFIFMAAQLSGIWVIHLFSAPQLIPLGAGNLQSLFFFFPFFTSYRTHNLDSLSKGILFFSLLSKEHNFFFPHISMYLPYDFNGNSDVFLLKIIFVMSLYLNKDIYFRPFVIDCLGTSIYVSWSLLWYLALGLNWLSS